MCRLDRARKKTNKMKTLKNENNQDRPDPYGRGAGTRERSGHHDQRQYRVDHHHRDSPAGSDEKRPREGEGSDRKRKASVKAAKNAASEVKAKGGLKVMTKAAKARTRRSPQRRLRLP
jgi:hypothetical protein